MVGGSVPGGGGVVRSAGSVVVRLVGVRTGVAEDSEQRARMPR